MKRVIITPLLLLAFTGCPAEDQLATGIYAKLGEPRPNATDAQRATFARGQLVAQRRFTPAEGLGPEVNVSFCGACHEKPTLGGSAGRYRNFNLVGQRLADDSFQFLGKGGVLPNYDLTSFTRTPTPAETNVLATRNPLPTFGSGLLAEIPDEEILKAADENDRDGDGISGRPNYDRGFVGRFGRKSQTVSIEGFIRGPLFNHAGITSDPLTEELRAQLPVPSNQSSRALGQNLEAEGTRVGVKRQAQAAAPDEPTVDTDAAADPELAPDELFDLVSFSMLLAAPEPEPLNETTTAGKKLFMQVKCGVCHLPTIKGPRGLIPAFTDLLLHDMGPEMDDGVIMKLATGAEFRTQPLWGIAAVGPYLHDGRADTLDDAIRLHGGEGSGSRDAYLALAEAQRAQVIEFLVSLGGREQTSSGLVPPDAPVPAVGTFGGPVAALSSTDEARFLAGREFFDRDQYRSAGLGPRFNGDSCRACHFDPVIGGSGPEDVNVLRQGILAMDLSFTAPPEGTMVHRHTADPGHRPEPNALTNFFEQRQTPPLFGLGLIDRIADADVIAREDPTDANHDGIKGRAHRLGDGRLGRLGWKANVPNLEEFARDALFNELGLTLPLQAGLSFGAMTDGDGVADPEVTVEQLDALVFFMKSLAPPPRTRKDVALEDRGQTVFATLGCDACHVPSMQTTDGKPVPLYSDLLLHVVSPDGTKGIGDAAGPREFRTTPLWGLAKTAPYLHDGSAASVKAAVLAHAGESSASRVAFEAASAADQAAVLAFLESL